MAYAGVLNDIKKCIALEKPERVPVFALSEEFDVRMHGDVYCDYNSNAEKMAKCQMDSIRKYGYDWAWLQVDDCIEFEVLGVGVKGEGNILPATAEYLPATYETLKNLKMPDFQSEGRMPVLLEAISKIKKEMGDTVCVTGRVAAPFSSATLLYGMTETLMLLYDEPELVKDTIDFFTEFQIKWGQAQRNAGADALWVGDCNASGHLISVEQYREFALEPTKQMIQAFDAAGLWSFYHASEHSIEHMKAQIETGISAISVGPGADLPRVMDEISHKCCVLGNLDPINGLLQGTAQYVTDEAKRIMEIGKSGGGYIFNSGEMIPRNTPEENMIAMISTAKSLAQY